MAGSKIQEKALKSMIAINAAIRNMHLYPISSVSAIKAIDKAYDSVQDILIHEETLIFAESEKRLIICRQPVNETDQKKAQISAFLGLLLNLGIKNISIRKGVPRSEFISFLEILSKATKNIGKEDTIKTAFAGRDLSHILVDHKVYVSLGKDEAAAPKNASVNIQQSFSPMMNTLDFILDSEKKEDVSKSLASSIANKDDQLLLNVLTQNPDGAFGSQLFENIIQQIDPERFERLIRQLKKMYENAQSKGSENVVAIEQTFQNLIRTEKGAYLQQRIRKQKEVDQVKKKKKIAYIRTGIDHILNEKDEVFKDKKLMMLLPGTICRLLTRNQNVIAERLIDRMGDSLLSQDFQIRQPVAHGLCVIIENAASNQHKKNLIQRLSYNLSDWIRMESIITAAYEKITSYLKDMAQDHICEGRLDACNHIMETFHVVAYPNESENPKKEMLAQSALQALTNSQPLNIILDEFHSNDEERRKQAVHTLTRMGEFAAGALLKILHDSEDRFERAQIIKVISDIGPPAIQAMAPHLEQNHPWYYMRNLMVLFSRVGSESHVDLIIPFLRHKDRQVQHECLNAIYTIAPKSREDILISALPNASERMKEDIVRMLGRLRSQKVVPTLLDFLSDEAIKVRSKLGGIVCVALGYIGAAEAVPLLEKIAQKDSDSPFVNKTMQAAAAKALEMIQNAA